MPTSEEEGVLERIGQRLFTLRITVVLARNLDERRHTGIDVEAEEESLREQWGEYVFGRTRGRPVTGQGQQRDADEPSGAGGGGALVDSASGSNPSYAELAKAAEGLLEAMDAESSARSTKEGGRGDAAAGGGGAGRDRGTFVSASSDDRRPDPGVLRRIATLGRVLGGRASHGGVAGAKSGGAGSGVLGELRTRADREAEAASVVNRRLVLARASALGTDPILLETIISLDGDVTTRLSEAWLEAADDPDGRRMKTALELQQMGIKTAVSWWSSLIELVSNVGTTLLGLVRRP